MQSVFSSQAMHRAGMFFAIYLAHVFVYLFISGSKAKDGVGSGELAADHTPSDILSV